MVSKFLIGDNSTQRCHAGNPNIIKTVFEQYLIKGLISQIVFLDTGNHTIKEIAFLIRERNAIDIIEALEEEVALSWSKIFFLGKLIIANNKLTANNITPRIISEEA